MWLRHSRKLRKDNCNKKARLSVTLTRAGLEKLIDIY
jgi:hypothetical protein